MQRYALSVIKHGYDPETPNAVEAARETLGWFHDQLLGLGQNDPVAELLAVGLTIKRDWALHALIDHGGGGWAKREQLALTAGRPLAICTGGGYPTYWNGLRAWTQGCLFVFEEPPNVGGKKWGRLCPNCQNRAGHRKPYRDARRALKHRVEEIAAIREDR